MSKIDNLPEINLETLQQDVIDLLDSKQVDFKSFSDAPKSIKFLAALFDEAYIAYKSFVYVPNEHLLLASSKNNTERIIATSKLLPWVYAIKNNETRTIFSVARLLSNTYVRSYYFLFEYALLKSHDIEGIPDTIAIGFLSSRRNWLRVKKRPDAVLKVLKSILETKFINH